MVIGKGTANGRDIVILGLSRLNIKKLEAGMPIRITAQSHPGSNLDMDVLIVFGETESAIAEDLAQHCNVDDETKVVVSWGGPKTN